MTTLSRYLLIDLLRPAAATLFTLLGIIWLMQSLRFLDLMVNKGLDISTFLRLTGLLVPSLLIVIMPVALFMGICFAYKRLFDDNEMTPLLGVGFSRFAFLKAPLTAGILTVIIGYILTLILIPWGMTSFKNLQEQLRNEKGTLLLEAGTFNQVDDDIMVYLKKRTGFQTLEELLVHDTRNPERPVTWLAERGEVTLSAEGYPRLKLTRGIRQEVGDDQVNMLEFREHTLDVFQRFDTPPERWRDAEERYLPELITPDRKLSPQQQNRFLGEIHKRLLWPLLPLPLVFIAAAIMVRTPERRLSSLTLTGQAIAYGLAYVAVTLVLHNLAREGEPILLYGQWAWPAVIITLCLLKLSGESKS